MGNVFALAGCSPGTLIHYLKALGAFRLLAKQKDPRVRGWWQGNAFNIETRLSRNDLLEFFLSEYAPSPITAPWNAGSGYYGGSAAAALEEVETSENERLAMYRATIKSCRDIISSIGVEDKPGEQERLHMLALCRSNLPDYAVDILDSLYTMTGGFSKGSFQWQRRFAPIYGVGGSDGRLEFTYTFIKYLKEIIAFTEEKKENKQSPQWLVKALFGTGNPALLKDSVGLYHPGGIGGPNSARGDRVISLVNPWDYILAIEGGLTFAGATSRRFSSEGTRAVASFPFNVEATAAGWSTLPASEVDDNRRNSGELWLPLWGKPSSYLELEYVFSEGRAQIGRRTAANGLDFVRAIGMLGIDRGITSFSRIGLMKGDRNGRAHLAVPLGRIPVKFHPEITLLNEIDPWLNRFRAFCDQSGAARYRRELRAVEEAMFAFSRHGGARRLQDILIALGNAEQAVGLAAIKSQKEVIVQPLALSSRWLGKANDSTPEFRIATAVASIAGNPKEGFAGIRENCEPVALNPKTGRYQWQDSTAHVPLNDLPRALEAILRRRMITASQLSLELLSIQGVTPTTVDDVQLYLNGQLDEDRMLGLLKGLILVNYPNKITIETPASNSHVDSSYALLKLLFLPSHFTWTKQADPIKIRPEQVVLTRLSSLDIAEGVRVALRRLKSSGLLPKMTPEDAGNLLTPVQMAKRMAGALLIPVFDWRRLANSVLIKPEEENEEEMKE